MYTCFSIGCTTLSRPNNGTVYIYNETDAIIAEYKINCTPGFEVVGNTTRECINNSWTGQDPSCKGKNFPEYIRLSIYMLGIATTSTPHVTIFNPSSMKTFTVASSMEITPTLKSKTSSSQQTQTVTITVSLAVLTAIAIFAIIIVMTFCLRRKRQKHALTEIHKDK